MTEMEIAYRLSKMEDEEFVYSVLQELLKLFVLCDNPKILPMLMEVRKRHRALPTIEKEITQGS